MNHYTKIALLMIALVGINQSLYSATSMASGTITTGSAITDLKDAFPYEGKIVIKSKVKDPVYLAFFNDDFKTLGPVTGIPEAVATLKENEHIVLTLTKKGTRPVVLVSRDKSKLDAALAITSSGKRNDFIWDLLKSSTADLNYFTPAENEVFLVYMNNEGLIPGLLRGAGIVNAKNKDTSFTKPGKMGALRLVYKDKNNFMIVQKPKEYAEYAQKAAVKGSPLPTIEGVVDDVVAFEKAKGY